MTEHLNREMTTALFKHFHVFFNVGDRSWAISQNIMVGGKLNGGGDLTSESTYALLDAFYELNLPQPFLSVFMGGIDTGIDLRDTKAQGTKHNASGCLIHGLSVVADSFTAIDTLLKERPLDASRLLKLCQCNDARDFA